MLNYYPPERYRRPVNLRQMIRDSAARYGEKALFKYFDDEENMKEVSFIDFHADVKALGTVFHHMELNEKKIAVLSESRPEWIAAYCAAICSTNIIVPLDKELVDEQIANFINSSDAEIVFYSAAFHEKINVLKEALPKVKGLICFDDENMEDGRFRKYSDILEAGYDLLSQGSEKYSLARLNTTKPAAIIFTSGTTGTSKGVMLSHDNILSCINASANMVNFNSDDILLSVLPLHHTYETCCGILTPILLGATVCFNNSLKYFMRNAAIVKPTGMVLVPLFVSTIYKKIKDEIKKTKKERIVSGAVSATKNLRKVGIDLRSVVFSSVRKALGGKLNKIICGGAALEPDLVARFDEFGIEICQGYGITECSPLVSVTPWTRPKYGTVGIPIKGSFVKIVHTDENGNEKDLPTGEIGEICIKGPHVMLGYYNNPEATREAFTQDGFFKSGDYGYMDEENYIFITGRKKNIIILPNGKNVYPEEIEEYLYRLEVINECVVVGKEAENGEIILSAIIYPEYSMFGNMDDAQIIEIMKQEVLKVNKKLPLFKQVRNIELKKSEFEKTTSKKIIRHKI